MAKWPECGAHCARRPCARKKKTGEKKRRSMDSGPCGEVILAQGCCRIYRQHNYSVWWARDCGRSVPLEGKHAIVNEESTTAREKKPADAVTCLAARPQNRKPRNTGLLCQVKQAETREEEKGRGVILGDVRGMSHGTCLTGSFLF